MNPIGWCTDTWNPITGCSPMSEGCDHCYANRMATRLAGRFGYPADDPFRVTFHPDKLDIPLKWKKPRRVFVCSMSDLFHERVQDKWRERVFDVMNEAPQHTYLLLTKRPGRMHEWVRNYVKHAWYCDGQSAPGPTIWLGVTVENQQRADERIPILLDTPAAHRFVSCEPLLGPVNLTLWLTTTRLDPKAGLVRRIDPNGHTRTTTLDWAIGGAETGPGARPADSDWFRSLRDQCQAAGVPFYLKDNPGTIDGVQYRLIPAVMES